MHQHRPPGLGVVTRPGYPELDSLAFFLARPVSGSDAGNLSGVLLSPPALKIGRAPRLLAGCLVAATGRNQGPASPTWVPAFVAGDHPVFGGSRPTPPKLFSGVFLFLLETAVRPFAWPPAASLQTLRRSGAALALFELIKEGFRVVGFVHD